MVFMKFTNLGSYKVWNTYVFFPYLFAIFEILSDYPEVWFLVVFKMLLLGVPKVRNTYILPLGWCIYSFQPFIGNYFEGFLWGRYLFCFIRIYCCFTVRYHDVLLDYMGTPIGDPIGITLLKWSVHEGFWGFLK